MPSNNSRLAMDAQSIGSNESSLLLPLRRSAEFSMILLDIEPVSPDMTAIHQSFPDFRRTLAAVNC